MVEESIVVEKPAKETTSLVKQIIPQIYGNVTKEEAGRIYWEYEIGVHTIKCKSQIKPQSNHSVITTTAHSKTRKSSSKRIIDKFHNSLENSEDIITREFGAAPDGKAVETGESGVHSYIKSISQKHIIIATITLVAGAFSYFKFRRR